MDLSKIFKDLVWDALVSLALKKLFAAIPFLGWGPIGWVVTLLASKLSAYLFDALHEVIDLQLIIIRKNELAQEYAKSAYELKLLAETKGIDSDEFKAEREKAKLALARFIKFGA